MGVAGSILEGLVLFTTDLSGDSEGGDDSGFGSTHMFLAFSYYTLWVHLVLSFTMWLRRALK